MHHFISLNALKEHFGLIRPRTLYWFLLSVLVLSSGFRNGNLPLSQSLSSLGIAAALLFVTGICYLVVAIALKLFSKSDLRESKQAFLEFACFSLLVVSIICLLPGFNWFFAQVFSPGRGIRWIRVWIGIAIFMTMQAFATQALSSKVFRYLSNAGSRWDSSSWIKFAAPVLIAIIIAEMATHGLMHNLQVIPIALLLNAILLTSIAVLVWAFTNRDLFALTLVIVDYYLLSLANAIKIQHLQVGLHIGDQSYLEELAELKGFVSTRLLCIVGATAIAVLGLLVIAWRKSKRKLNVSHRVSWIACSVIAFMVVVGSLCFSSSRAFLSHVGVRENLGTSLGSTKRNGLLVELALQLPVSFLSAPPSYGPTEVKLAINRQPQQQQYPINQRDNSPPAIIVFFFESLADPKDFARLLSREVVPHFKALQSSGIHGFTVSPRLTGGSADSEFEFLTGMSCSFLPQGSCPYKHYIKRQLPNLVSILRDSRGYDSTAVKCVGPGFYSFSQAYEYLQFNNFCYSEKFVSQTCDKFSGHLSDDSFVDEMLRPLAHSPCLVVGENLNSHCPYFARSKGDKPRFLVEPSNSASDQIETYLQAISRTDDALGRMIAVLKQRKDRVLLLVVGDHHPPLPASSGAYDFPAYREPGPAGELFRHRLPFAVWKNFENETKSTAQTPPSSAAPPPDETYISMNFLSLLLLREAGIQPEGLIAWNQELFEQCPVVSRNLFYTEGQAKSWDELSPGLQQRVREYELLQYDLLIGEQYAAEIWAKNATPAEPNRPAAAEKPDR